VVVGRKPASLSSASDGMAPKGIHQSVAVSALLCGIGYALLKHSPKGIKMRLCSCGGVIDTYELTSGRVRWICRSCKRMETFFPLQKSDDMIQTTFIEG
jgi:hypothetical protein